MRATLLYIRERAILLSILLAILLGVYALASSQRYLYLPGGEYTMYVRDRWTGDLKWCRGRQCYHVYDFVDSDPAAFDKFLQENSTPIRKK
jgi:hypothetical protein